MKLATLCYLHPHKVPGGQQRVAYDLFQQAASKFGRENSLFIASDFNSEPLRTAQSSRLVEVGPGEFVYVCRGYDFRFFTNFDFPGQLEMIRLLESFEPDVIHMHHFLGFGLDFISFVRAQLPGCRLVFTVHEFLSICHNNGHLRRKHDGGICGKVHAVDCQQCFPQERLDYFEHRKIFFGDMLSKFDGLSTVSEFARHTIEQNLPLKERVQVISNGPLRPREQAVRKRKFGSTDRCVIGFIGQVHPVKGVDLLLDAVSELVADGTVEARRIEVQIFGNLIDPAYREKLEARVAHTNGQSLKTTLRGVYSPTNLSSVFSDVDIVVVPSMWPESYCLTADEAILAEKTLVCANFPAVRERIRESKGTFFFESGSAKDLKRALVEAITSLERGEWENPFSMRLSTPEALYESYESQLYRKA